VRTTTAIQEPKFNRPVTGADLIAFQRDGFSPRSDEYDFILIHVHQHSRAPLLAGQHECVRQRRFRERRPLRLEPDIRQIR